MIPAAFDQEAPPLPVIYMNMLQNNLNFLTFAKLSLLKLWIIINNYHFVLTLRTIQLARNHVAVWSRISVLKSPTSSETTLLLWERYRMVCWIASNTSKQSLQNKVGVPPPLLSRERTGAALVAVLTMFWRTVRKELDWCHKIPMKSLLLYFHTPSSPRKVEIWSDILFHGLVHYVL